MGMIGCIVRCAALAGLALAIAATARVTTAHAAPKVVVISLDGVEPLFCHPNVVAFGQCGNTGAAGRTIAYDVRAAALDTSDDAAVNYDRLVVFDARIGVQPGPFTSATRPTSSRATPPCSATSTTEFRPSRR